MQFAANLLFEAGILKNIPRSGYHFLGAGKESVAEHSFITTFIAYVMSQTETQADSQKLITMCLIHDLPEARIGDLNYVHKRYVTPDEKSAVSDMTAELPFGASLTALIEEFNAGETLESKLARDADQIAFILDLKALSDIGYSVPQKWLPSILKRLQTELGKSLAETILHTDSDAWWLKKVVQNAT